MSLNLPDFAGNMGHKDQVLALKWVDKNIKQFGGGDDRTTLLGHDTGTCCAHVLSLSSSFSRPFDFAYFFSLFLSRFFLSLSYIEQFLFIGAISVSLHMISPASQGLFENAIVLSGSALNPSIPRVKDHLTILYNLAESLHYPVDNNRDLLEFLHQIDGKLLTKRTFQDFTNTGFGRRMANLIWATAVERE